MMSSRGTAERDRTEYPDDLYGSVANTDLSGIAAKNLPDPFLEPAVGIIGIPGQVLRVAVPVDFRGKGINARAEIQHVFSGFFPLPFSGTPMNHSLWKVNSHKNPLFSLNTWFSSHKCVVRNAEISKKKVFISTCFILSYLVKSDTRVLYV
jgi:hypothetical protein